MKVEKADSKCKLRANGGTHVLETKRAKELHKTSKTAPLSRYDTTDTSIELERTKTTGIRSGLGVPEGEGLADVQRPQSTARVARGRRCDSRQRFGVCNTNQLCYATTRVKRNQSRARRQNENQITPNDNQT